MIDIRRSVSFSVENKAQGENSSLPEHCSGRLRGIVVWNGNRVRLVVATDVNPKAWLAPEQRFKPRSCHGFYKTSATAINRDITDFEERVHSIFNRFEREDVMPTKADFTRAYNESLRQQAESDRVESEKSQDRSIFPYYDEFINDGIMSGRWTQGTVVKVRTIRKHLHAISPNLTFSDLDDNGMVKIIQYFNHAPTNSDSRDGLSNTTIMKDIAFIKTFVRWCNEKGYCERSKFASQKVKLRVAKRPVIFLTWDELMHVYHFDFSASKAMEQVRDVFCFCCFTSLRYSDVFNLRRSNVQGNAIRITTVKTHDTLSIELNDYSEAILNKYKDVPFPNGKALPVISNQKMNDHLKDMGRMCGLDSPIVLTVYRGTDREDNVYKKWELLSTHVGRKTFISNALMLGIPPDIVMKWTGHSDYKAMRPYIAIADSAKSEAMKAFNKS